MKYQFILLFFLWSCLAGSTLGQRIYLSGKDASSAIPWDFKMSTGRNNGYWTTIPVPSNWELHGFGYYTYGADHENYEDDPEIGYYKQKFQLNNIEDKKFRLTFQGVMTDTHVKINGKKAGDVHRGGFMQFNYDITDLVKTGENLIEVEVHKSSEDENVQEAERITDFWLFGGIYRPVYIDVLPTEYIDRVAIDAQMDGTFKMDVYVEKNNAPVRITAQLLDAQGNAFGMQISSEMEAGQSVIRLREQFPGVKLWSHEYPNLYTVNVQLLSKGKQQHSYSEKFGFRTFEVRDHDGFYLNGKRILLKGAAMHSFRPNTGRALSKTDIEENVHIMKDLNFNCVRPCHYPPDEYLFELCDSLGLLAMDELTGWHHPLNYENGKILTKELIARDVNHPSIILWGNGNHFAHNPGLDDVFFKWDIQNRRPLKNTARVEEWPGDYDPEFDAVDTRFYPNYEQLTERLADDHIYLSNEILHSLYDGGGAAALSDYWKEFQSSDVGGGMMIWALFDEGIYRTDLNEIDVQVNKAPDGLLGPNGEKEASYFAVKEIWSPVQFEMDVIPDGFDGSIPVKNEYSFVNLNECEVLWELVNFTSPYEAQSGFRVIHHGKAKIPNIYPGESGNIRLDLPGDWQEYNALRVVAFNRNRKEIITKVWPVATEKQLTGQLVLPSTNKINQDQSDKYRFTIGDNSLKFDSETGMLQEIQLGGKTLPVRNLPFLTAESSDGEIQPKETKGTVKSYSEDEKYIIESTGNNGFDWFKWEINPNGTVTLSYEYTLPEGEYHYAGIGMEVDAEKLKSKRWLGEGPYRIWKNRTEGGILNVWESEKHLSIPGEIWNYPSFEGNFAPWYWAVFRFTNQLKFGLSCADDNLILGVLNPTNGEDPKHAVWHYPEKEGIFLFNYISAVGAKWKPAHEFGPSSQPAAINGSRKGTVQFHLMKNHNNNSNSGKRVKEIE